MYRPFMADDGRLIIPRRHVATFRGKHNCNTAKVCIVLYDRVKRGENSGLSVGELAKYTGCNYDSLRAKMSKWYEWRYLDRRAVGNNGERPHYNYTIAQRGINFVQYRIPAKRYKDYVAEINAFRAGKRAWRHTGPS